MFYEYYPEDKQDFKPGLIQFDFSTKDIQFLQISEIEEKAKIKSIQTNSSSQYSDFVYYRYGKHVIRKLFESFQKQEILEKGISIWY